MNADIPLETPTLGGQHDGGGKHLASYTAQSADCAARGLFGEGVPVSGSLSSNSVETILASVLAGVGIGMFHRASLVEEFQQSDVITVLDEFIDEPRDVSLVWPKRRFVPTRVRRATDFFAMTLPLRI